MELVVICKKRQFYQERGRARRISCIFEKKGRVKNLPRVVQGPRHQPRQWGPLPQHGCALRQVSARRQGMDGPWSYQSPLSSAKTSIDLNLTTNSLTLEREEGERISAF
jgi:hypothetical protein